MADNVSPCFCSVIIIQHLPGTNKELGLSVLESRGATTDPHWYWIGVAALIGFILFYALLANLALAYLKRKPNMCLINN